MYIILDKRWVVSCNSVASPALVMQFIAGRHSHKQTRGIQSLKRLVTEYVKDRLRLLYTDDRQKKIQNK